MGTSLKHSMSGFLRQPLLHFLLLGAALGALYTWMGRQDAGADKTVRITAAQLSRLQAQWQARWNRPPTPDEMEGIIRQQIREAVVYQEALAMGLDQDDPIVRRVLVQKLEGMARNLVELSLSPTDQDLATYFAENKEQYRPDPLITFTHVFVDPDRREEQTLPDAAAMLVELQSLHNPMEDAERFGDPFMLQSYYPEKTEQRVSSLFGGGFARSVFELQPGVWHGPVLSGYGTHLVYVEALDEFPDPELSDVKDRVVQEWTDKTRTEITEQYFDDLLARYEVVVERESPEGTVEAASVQTP